VEIEKRGKPTVTICTNRFEILAHVTATGLGMPNLPVVVVPHPIGGISLEEVKIKTDDILDNVIGRLLR
jgi:hypothetical protein